MFRSWFVPGGQQGLWVCAAAFLVLIPVSVWHDRNWKRTLAEYAQKRREASGAAADDWPRADVAVLMGLQLWLVLSATIVLAAMAAAALWAAILWPRLPWVFPLRVNPYDLPYVWGLTTVIVAAAVGGVALAIAIWRSPWWPVARKIRRAVYARPDERERFFAEALERDPGLTHRV